MSSQPARHRRLFASPTTAVVASAFAHLAALAALPGWHRDASAPPARSVSVTLRMAPVPAPAEAAPARVASSPDRIAARPVPARPDGPPSPARPVVAREAAPAVLAVHREADLARHAEVAGPPAAPTDATSPPAHSGSPATTAAAGTPRVGERVATAYAANHGAATRHTDVAYLHSPKPGYPPMARQLGLEGTATVRVLVNRDGLPEESRILASSGASSLDQAALEGVRRWRFVPARQGDTPVAHWVDIPVTFRLAGRD